MVLLNSIIITTLIVFGVFDNYMYAYTRDKWDHAVNSQDELKKALESDSTMIEADVTLGIYYDESVEKGEGVSQIPIMGRPPAINSDLSLQQFLSAWSQNKNKKVKLVFKSTKAFTTAIPIMEQSFKFWLHADILRGTGDMPTVDAATFISNTKKKFPNSMLSLGWTTKNNDYIGDQYRWENIRKMVDILQPYQPITQPATYAVKASLAVNSIRQIEGLLKYFGMGLTIWSRDPGDVIDYKKLFTLINLRPFGRVYLDLPDNISEAFFKEYET